MDHDRGAHEALYAELLDEIGAEFPGFRLVRKGDSMLQRSIAVALTGITFGAQRAYLTDYVTTLGQRVYVPDDWDDWPAGERWATLRHERVHLRQFRRFTLPLMALLYLVFPLPFGLAWARMRLEREAYAESIRAAFVLHGRRRVCSAAFRARIVGQFTSGAYGWMWPFRRAVERWYDGVVAAL